MFEFLSLYYFVIHLFKRTYWSSGWSPGHWDAPRIPLVWTRSVLPSPLRSGCCWPRSWYPPVRRLCSRHSTGVLLVYLRIPTSGLILGWFGSVCGPLEGGFGLPQESDSAWHFSPGLEEACSHVRVSTERHAVRPCVTASRNYLCQTLGDLHVGPFPVGPAAEDVAHTWASAWWTAKEGHSGTCWGWDAPELRKMSLCCFQTLDLWSSATQLWRLTRPVCQAPCLRSSATLHGACLRQGSLPRKLLALMPCLMLCPHPNTIIYPIISYHFHAFMFMSVLKFSWNLFSLKLWRIHLCFSS